jgi:hypothetical protein
MSGGVAAPIRSLRRHHDRELSGFAHSVEGFKSGSSRAPSPGVRRRHAEAAPQHMVEAGCHIQDNHPRISNRFAPHVAWSNIWENEDSFLGKSSMRTTSSYMFSLDNLVHEFLDILAQSLRRGDAGRKQEPLESKAASSSNPPPLAGLNRSFGHAATGGSAAPQRTWAAPTPNPEPSMRDPLVPAPRALPRPARASHALTATRAARTAVRHPGRPRARVRSKRDGRQDPGTQPGPRPPHTPSERRGATPRTAARDATCSKP